MRHWNYNYQPKMQDCTESDPDHNMIKDAFWILEIQWGDLWEQGLLFIHITGEIQFNFCNKGEGDYYTIPCPFEFLSADYLIGSPIAGTELLF